MVAPTVDESEPTFDGTAVDDAMDQTRDNYTYLLSQLAAQSYHVPPWNATPAGADLDKPDSVEMVHSDGRKIKATYSYTGDNLTQMVIAFDDGGGYVNFVKGTGAISYNGSDQWTGTVWS